MSRTAKFEPAVVEAARTALAGARTIRGMRAAQAILLPALFGLSREQTAEATGLSVSRTGGLQTEARKHKKNSRP